VKRFSVLLAVVLLAGAALAAFAGSTRATAPFFFIQITDPQFGFSSADADFAQESASFEFAIATANRLRPAFVVVTGDLVNRTGDAAQIAEYQRIAARLDRAIPLYNVAGNHDVGNVPTAESLAAYSKQFGPDHYSFRVEGFAGIVLDSCLVVAPQQAREQADTQDTWLEAELERARREGTRHVVVFEHHALFLSDPAEPDEYFNIPREPRSRLLGLFRRSGTKFVFAGHHHRNSLARDGDIEMVTTGPIGKPLGEGKSGLRIAIVTDAGITHRYYDLGELPNRIVLPK
jgi:predicted phosphodiesterase